MWRAGEASSSAIKGDEGEGLDGPDIMAFRQNLLEGRVPPACQACSNAADCSTSELEQTVRAILIPAS